MKKVINYFKEAWAELGKIEWPSRSQSLRLTGAVLAFSAILSLFMGLADVGFNELVKKVIVGA